MANPQTEDGYTRLANELLDALISIRIPGEVRQIFDCILRKTYGFKKKEDKIPLSQFCLATKMDRSNIVRAIKKALSMNLIIVKKDTGNITIYSLQKDFSKWKPLSKKTRGLWVVSKKTIPSVKKDNDLLSKKTHSKENTKDIYSKDNSYVESEDSTTDFLEKKKKEIIFQKNSKAYILANHLLGEILLNLPRFKIPNLQNWAVEVDKMLRIDNRSPEEIDFLIHWSQKNEFWFKNILSTKKLRLQFDVLTAQAKFDWFKIQKEKKQKELSEMKF